jgi:hypothetical protein
MDSCRMYSLFTLSGSLKVWKANYCTDNYERCARFQLSKQAKPVPDNLLPNGTLLRKEFK